MDDHPGPPGRRGVTSGALAMALVLAAVAAWWLFSGNGPQGPPGNDSRYAVPDDEVIPSAVASSRPTPAVPGAVGIDSYVVRDALRVALNYRIGADCDEDLDATRVLETEAAVSITLTVSPGTKPARCGPPVERHTTLVRLDSPLEGRAILDGSTAPQVRVEPSATTYE